MVGQTSVSTIKLQGKQLLCIQLHGLYFKDNVFQQMLLSLGGNTEVNNQANSKIIMKLIMINPQGANNPKRHCFGLPNQSELPREGELWNRLGKGLLPKIRGWCPGGSGESCQLGNQGTAPQVLPVSWRALQQGVITSCPWLSASSNSKERSKPWPRGKGTGTGVSWLSPARMLPFASATNQPVLLGSCSPRLRSLLSKSMTIILVCPRCSEDEQGDCFQVSASSRVLGGTQATLSFPASFLVLQHKGPNPVPFCWKSSPRFKGNP